MQIEVHSSVAEASEKNHDNDQLKQSFSRPKFKHGTSRYVVGQ